MFAHAVAHAVSLEKKSLISNVVKALFINKPALRQSLVRYEGRPYLFTDPTTNKAVTRASDGSINKDCLSMEVSLLLCVSYKHGK